MNDLDDSKYHPERYRASRPFFGAVYRIFRDTCDEKSGSPTASGLMAASEKLGPIWNEELRALSFDQRPANARRFNQEISMFHHVARCFYSGRNIFHLVPELSTLLRMTDIDDVRWDSIRLPYPTFYLWFGAQAGWELESSGLVDGAYVSQGEQRIEITLTSAGLAPADSSNFVLSFEPYYYASFDTAGDGSTIGSSLRQKLDADLKMNQDLTDREQTAINEAGITLRSLPREESGEHAASVARQEQLPVFMQALRLVINGICFLTAEPEDVVAQFPREAIPTNEDPANLSKREAKRLRSRGYSTINFVGKKFVRSESSGDVKVELSSHHRRAFWRNQTYGPRNSERRLTWIRPTVVRKDKIQSDQDPMGHTYIVQPSSANEVEA